MFRVQVVGLRVEGCGFRNLLDFDEAPQQPSQLLLSDALFLTRRHSLSERERERVDRNGQVFHHDCSLKVWGAGFRDSVGRGEVSG